MSDVPSNESGLRIEMSDIEILIELAERAPKFKAEMLVVMRVRNEFQRFQGEMIKQQIAEAQQKQAAIEGSVTPPPNSGKE